MKKGDKKNKLGVNKFEKKEIKNMLFSLQLLIDYFQKENFDRYDQIGDLIKKLPKEVNICDEIRLFFKSNNQFKKWNIILFQRAIKSRNYDSRC